MRAASLLLAALILSGCRREDIAVYRVPKEKAAATARHEHSPAAPPRLEWKLPPGWEERGPGRMTIASFAIRGTEGQEAEVSVMPMPGEGAGNLSLLVNIVRDGAGMAPIDDAELANLVEDVRVGEATAKLVDLSGATAGSGGNQGNRIVLAVLTRAGTTWFFKLAGSAGLVSSQKNAFLDFLRSIEFHPAEAQALENSISGGGNPGRDAAAGPNWKVPDQWQELPAGQMQIARFAVPARGSAKAEVSVSVFDNDTGGTLGNVNRWRGQIGLAGVQESELAPLLSPLDPANSEAILVDMTNANRRLLGAIVPRGGQYWFYKLLGDTEAVAPEMEAFVAFARSAP